MKKSLTEQKNKSILAHVSKNSDMVFEEERFLDHSVKKSTRATYEASIIQCELLGLLLPCSPQELVTFIARNVVKFGASTLGVRLAAVNNWHIERGLPSPTRDPLVLKAKSAFKNLKEEAGERVKKVCPLNAAFLASVSKWCKLEDDKRARRDRAIIFSMYFAALRSNEVCGMEVGDLEFDAVGARLNLWGTKTGDKTRVIPYNRANPDLCAATALHCWLDERRPKMKKDKLFVGYHKGYITPRSGVMSTRAIRDIVKYRANQAGYPNWDSFAGHSPRRGFVKDAIDGGASVFDVVRGGGWKTVNTVMEYHDSNEAAAVNVLIDNSGKET